MVTSFSRSFTWGSAILSARFQTFRMSCRPRHLAAALKIARPFLKKGCRRIFSHAGCSEFSCFPLSPGRYLKFRTSSEPRDVIPVCQYLTHPFFPVLSFNLSLTPPPPIDISTMTPFASSPSTGLTSRTVDTPDGTLKFHKRLISGSSGTVYKAEYTKTGRRVAVKVIPRSTQSADRSTEEFTIQNDVQGHENIAHTIALYPDVHLGYRGIHKSFTGDLLVFDWYNGGDLFSAISSYRYGAQENQIRDAFLQVLSAVEYCHRHGVYHRDIKPENILCSEDLRHVFLTDFGLATREAMVHCRCGSSMYMSWGKQFSTPFVLQSPYRSFMKNVQPISLAMSLPPSPQKPQTCGHSV